MKNTIKNKILGYQVEIKPQGEIYYIEYMGFYFTKAEAEARKKACVPLLLDGDKIRIKQITL